MKEFVTKLRPPRSAECGWADVFQWVPMGYERIDKKLMIENVGADKTKLIFDKYLEFKSVLKLKTYLDKNEVKTRSDKYFSKGQLYHLLANKLYVGKIIHKENIYEGEHEAIIESEVFEKVQKILLENRVDKNCGIKSSSNSLLAGLIYDDKNNKMSPSHSTTRKRRYRYYLSQAVKKFNKNQAGSMSKIPAGEIEKFVVETIKEFLLDRKKMQKIICEFDVTEQNDILSAMQDIEDFYNPRLIRAILNKVVISKESVEITICEKALLKTLDHLTRGINPPEELKGETNVPIVILKKVQISQPSKTGNILIISSGDNSKPIPNPYLVKAIVKSHYYHRLLLDGKVNDIFDLQNMEGLKDTKYIRNILNLKFLPSKLTEQILNGMQPPYLGLQKLFLKKY